MAISSPSLSTRPAKSAWSTALSRRFERLIRRQQIDLCICEDKPLGQENGEIAHDALSDLWMVFAKSGVGAQRQFETLNHRIRPYVRRAPVLKQRHLAEHHAGDKRRETHTIRQLHTHHAALQKEQR